MPKDETALVRVVIGEKDLTLSHPLVNTSSGVVCHHHTRLDPTPSCLRGVTQSGGNGHQQLDRWFGRLVGHTILKQSKLLARVRRVKGQVEAVERALEEERECYDVLRLISSIRGAVNGLTAEVMEDHIRNHVVNPDVDPDPLRAQGAEELIEVVRSYLK
jgi:DNA-binding FrmR family transcriptional regulator